MKFCEAMDAMRDGAKVSRLQWSNSLYFKTVEGVVKCYQPMKQHFTYNEEIMLSDGWIVDGIEESMQFCYVIDYLIGGKKAKLSNWDNDSYIQYDWNSKQLIYSCMSEFNYTPEFNSFSATDWVILP